MKQAVIESMKDLVHEKNAKEFVDEEKLKEIKGVINDKKIDVDDVYGILEELAGWALYDIIINYGLPGKYYLTMADIKKIREGETIYVMMPYASPAGFFPLRKNDPLIAAEEGRGYFNSSGLDDEGMACTGTNWDPYIKELPGVDEEIERIIERCIVDMKQAWQQGCEFSG